MYKVAICLWTKLPGMSRKNLCSFTRSVPTPPLMPQFFPYCPLNSVFYPFLNFPTDFWGLLNPNECLPWFHYPRFEPVEWNKEVANREKNISILTEHFWWPMGVATPSSLTLNHRIRHTCTLSPRLLKLSCHSTTCSKEEQIRQVLPVVSVTAGQGCWMKSKAGHAQFLTLNSPIRYFSSQR